MKKVQIYSTAMSVGCAIGVLMAVILTGNENTLPRTAVVVPTKNPISLQASTRSRLPSQLPFQRIVKPNPDGIDSIITTSIPRNRVKRVRKNIEELITTGAKSVNPYPGSVAKNGATIKVRAGDTLFAIARRSGINAHKLAKLNAIDAPFVIRPGQILHLGPTQ